MTINWIPARSDGNCESFLLDAEFHNSAYYPVERPSFCASVRRTAKEGSSPHQENKNIVLPVLTVLVLIVVLS
jgi:hypothetical protein